MLLRRNFPGHRKKTGYNQEAFRIEPLESEENPVYDETNGYSHRAAGDQPMPLRICHGTPPARFKFKPNRNHCFQYPYIYGFILKLLNPRSKLRKE